MKKILAFLLAALICLTFASCGTSSSENTSEGGNVRLTFAESINMDRIKELSGKTVEMIGYMATISPVNGEYLYLMNLPYQSCPYCVPNTQQLSNTIAVYAKDGDRFDFTDGPINVIGTMETGDFSDEYGYTYNYRIKDATYIEVNSTEASEKLALWEKISNIGLAADVYSMFDFVDFECNWPNYKGQFQEGEAYLYPADVAFFEEKQFTDQSADGYFDTLVKHAQGVDADIMQELVSIIYDSQSLVDRAKQERESKLYTYDKETDRFTLTNGEELMQNAKDLYYRYATWLENFSLSN